MLHLAIIGALAIYRVSSQSSACLECINNSCEGDPTLTDCVDRFCAEPCAPTTEPTSSPTTTTTPAPTLAPTCPVDCSAIGSEPCCILRGCGYNQDGDCSTSTISGCEGNADCILHFCPGICSATTTTTTANPTKSPTAKPTAAPTCPTSCSAIADEECCVENGCYYNQNNCDTNRIAGCEGNVDCIFDFCPGICSATTTTSTTANPTPPPTTTSSPTPPPTTSTTKTTAGPTPMPTTTTTSRWPTYRTTTSTTRTWPTISTTSTTSRWPTYRTTTTTSKGNVPTCRPTQPSAMKWEMIHPAYKGGDGELLWHIYYGDFSNDERFDAFRKQEKWDADEIRPIVESDNKFAKYAAAAKQNEQLNNDAAVVSDGPSSVGGSFGVWIMVISMALVIVFGCWYKFKPNGKISEYKPLLKENQTPVYNN